MYLFSNVIGVFVFDSQFKIVDELLFKSIDDYKKKEKFIEKLRSKHKNLEEPDEQTTQNILLQFRNSKYLHDFYSKNLELTKLDVKNSVNEDNLIIQSIKSIGEIDKSIGLLAKRLREWYDLYTPEFSRATESHEAFVEAIIEKNKAELLNKMNITNEESIGAELDQEDVEQINFLANQVHSLFRLRKNQLGYISAIMDDYSPNIKAVCDVNIAAKLIEHAGSLKRLSILPASTIQILGAEKALFRHMKTGAKPPRHGLIVGHSLMAKTPERCTEKSREALPIRFL